MDLVYICKFSTDFNLLGDVFNYKVLADFQSVIYDLFLLGTCDGTIKVFLGDFVSATVLINFCSG